MLTGGRASDHQDERRRDRDAAAARDGRGVDPPGLGPVDHLVADHDPPDERGQDQGHQRGGDEGHDDRSDRAAELGMNVKVTSTPCACGAGS